MGSTNPISAIAAVRPVITVEHPDGTTSHIPVVQQDHALVARLPAGATIIDIAPERKA